MTSSGMTVGQAVLRRKMAEFGVELTPAELIKATESIGASKKPLDVRRGQCACCGKKRALLRNWCVDCLIRRPMIRETNGDVR